MIAPPTSMQQLITRAQKLTGLKLEQVAQAINHQLPKQICTAKGSIGELLELVLGANAGNQDLPDFIELGVELKTIPLDQHGHVRESTYICSINLQQIENEEWETSRVFRKLRQVLWFPVEWNPQIALTQRHLGRPLLWSPNLEEEKILCQDWVELSGKIAVGGIEEISAHLGQALQIRPKAAHGSVRTIAFGPERELLTTVPRGFYLRARFTEKILWRLTD